MSVITAAAFIELLKDTNPKKIMFGGKMVIAGDIDITQPENDYFPEIRVTNTEFKRKIKFHNLTLSDSIEFRDCIFNDEIEFNRVLANDRITKIAFYNCQILGVSFISCEGFTVSLNANNISSGLKLIECKRMRNLLIYGNTKLGTVEISKCEFEGELNIVQNEHCALILNYSKAVMIQILRNENNVLRVDIDNVNSSNMFINENNIVDNLHIRDIQVRDQMTICGNSVGSRLELNCNMKTEIDELLISEGDYGEGFFIQNSYDVVSIRKIIYKSSQKNIGPFYFTNLALNRFELEGTINNSSVILNNIKVDNLIFNNFFNYGVVSLAEVRGIDELKINNVNLGNCEIINCDFSDFEQVNIKNASLIAIKSVQTKWFSRKQLNQSNTKDIATIKTNREIYRQLKQAMYSQGDTIQALKFKSLEMNEYKHELDFSKWKYKSDWFIMFMNKSNNYGLNWVKPVGIAGVFTLVMYIILSNSFINSEYAMIGKKYGAYLWQHKYRLILLLDPTFDLKKVFSVDKNCELPFSMYFFGFIQRIGMTYLIFQTVAAFRKYLK
ncbi:MAG: hypothetical protein V4620_14125 [Bacteroidota bacterium]